MHCLPTRKYAWCAVKEYLFHFIIKISFSLFTQNERLSCLSQKISIQETVRASPIRAQWVSAVAPGEAVASHDGDFLLMTRMTT